MFLFELNTDSLFCVTDLCFMDQTLFTSFIVVLFNLCELHIRVFCLVIDTMLQVCVVWIRHYSPDSLLPDSLFSDSLLFHLIYVYHISEVFCSLVDPWFVADLFYGSNIIYLIHCCFI